MARKNRVTIPEGIYHVTARVAHREMLFKDPHVKDKIVEWMLGIAFFSGIELYAYCVMDNHLHLFFRVPRVPERLWLDPDEEPAAHAFGMRPAECRAPRWLPDSSEGDCPRQPRPPLGFMLDDREMLERLAALYSPETAREIGRRWRKMRLDGRAAAVDAEKERYCRRMYNLSQFVKTLAERIARKYNETFKHEGCVWQGRFYSAVVEKALPVLAVVAAYVEYNPVKAKLVATPGAWGHSSYSAACNDAGPAGIAARKAYERLFGCPWPEARARMEAIFGDGLPEDLKPETLKELYDNYDEDRETGGEPSPSPRGTLPAEEEEPTPTVEKGTVPIVEMGVEKGTVPIVEMGTVEKGTVPIVEMGTVEKGTVPVVVRKPMFRASQAIRAGMWFFKKGGYIGRDMAFGKAVVGQLPERFPHVSLKSIKRCRAFAWELPEPNRTKAA